jgi:hypothetical protein
MWCKAEAEKNKTISNERQRQKKNLEDRKKWLHCLDSCRAQLASSRSNYENAKE